MVGPVKTHSAHSAELESKKLSNRGKNLFLDFSLNRTGQKWGTLRVGADMHPPLHYLDGMIVTLRKET